MSSFAPYERFAPLSAQSKRNIGEGRVLKEMIARGEMPAGTTLQEAREFEVNLARRPRKGVRKKGLLPEMLKKDYKLLLDKKIKEFSKEEKRIYNALAQREKRGYVPRIVNDFALELENFLDDDEGGGGIEMSIEDIPPIPLEVAIPQGQSTSLNILPTTVDNPDTDEESEFEDDDGDWFSGAVDIPPPARPIAKRRPSRKNIVYLSAQELNDFHNPLLPDGTPDYRERQQRVMEVSLGYVRQDPEEERLRMIREKEESRIRKEKKRELKILEEERLANELEDFLDDRQINEVAPLKEELVSTIEEVRESRRKLGLPPDPLTEAQLRELNKDEFKKPVSQQKKDTPLRRLSSATSSDLSDVSDDDSSGDEVDNELDDIDTFIKDIEDRGKPISTISPISKQYDSDESLEGSDLELSDEDLNLTDEELEEYKDRGGYDPTPDPQSLFNYNYEYEAPILPRSRRHQAQTPPKVPSWAKTSRRGLKKSNMFDDKKLDLALSVVEENILPQVDDDYDVGFVFDDPTPTRRTLRRDTQRQETMYRGVLDKPFIPRKRQVRKANIPSTQQLIGLAGAGNLSLGGTKKSYRLKDFEARRPPPNPQGIPVLQMLLKNNRNRMKK
tara:strand:- start:2059 stop:3906 length:1848 start_codon:yes stop_codon:yes gene_type:complete